MFKKKVTHQGSSNWLFQNGVIVEDFRDTGCFYNFFPAKGIAQVPLLVYHLSWSSSSDKPGLRRTLIYLV